LEFQFNRDYQVTGVEHLIIEAKSLKLRISWNFQRKLNNSFAIVRSNDLLGVLGGRIF
jgi:hypothetical protein